MKIENGLIDLGWGGGTKCLKLDIWIGFLMKSRSIYLEDKGENV